MNMVNTTTEDLSDRLPFWSHVLALILFLLLFILAILGNCIALWILRRKPELRTLTHAFLTNLVVADLLLSLLTPFEALSIFLRSYVFGDPVCKLQRTFLYFFYAVSILTLSAISLERFVAICYPMSYNMLKERKTRVIVLIWLVSAVIEAPHIYLSEQRTVNDSSNDTVCFEFHTADDIRVAFFWGYALPCFLLLYFAPLIIVTVTYWRAALKLSEMEKRLKVNSRFDYSETVRVRKEVLGMLFVVVVLFVVQWTPFEIVEILVASPGFAKVNPISSLRVAVNMLAFSNAVFNPVVFGFMSKPFREGFKEAGLYLVRLRCCSGVTAVICQCACWKNISRDLIFQHQNRACSTTDLSQNTTSTLDINWDSSFSRLSNPISIVENELPINHNPNTPDCAADHSL